MEKVRLHDGRVTLYCGDCRDILPTLGPVDAVVTDPPYGIGADSAMHKAGGTKYGRAAAAKRVYASTNWDAEPADMAWVVDFGVPAIVFGGNYFHLPPARCWLVWDKKVNGEFADCELAWTNLDKPVRRIEWMWNGMLRRGQEPRGEHPTQKPVGVMKWCIEHLPASAETILDPYMGSGTTGVAAIALGRRFVGIERDPRYFEIACRRLAEAARQPDMLVAPVPALVQLALI